MNRIVLHVFQHIVHPAHIPLEVEAQAAHRGRTADRRPGGRFLGVGRGTGAFLPEDFIHAAQEMHGLEILAAAVDVRNPLARRAAVIAIEHRGHRIDAQTVDAIVFDPEKRIADEVVEDFASAKVVDQRSPILMHAFAWVGVFELRTSVKAAQSVFVGREVGRNPVDDDFEPGIVAGGDKITETLRRAKTCCRCVQPQRLVTPGAVKRVFGNRQEFEVRESQTDGVGNQCLRDPLPVEEAAFFVAPPGAQMHFVDRYR